MLQLIPNTKIRVIDGEQTKLVPVSELVGHHTQVYDFYGNRHDLRISMGLSPRRWLVQCMSGEMIQFGDQHTILGRGLTTAAYERHPIREMVGGFIRLPQKKISPPKAAAAALDMDDKTGAIFLSFDNIRTLVETMELVSSCGVTVERHKTKLRVDVESKRPVCWAAKLLNGNFQSDFTFAMNDLASRAIIHPHKMYGDAVLEETKRTGVIFEGNCVYNDFPFQLIRPIDKEAAVCVVEFDDPSLPVELTWFCT